MTFKPAMGLKSFRNTCTRIIDTHDVIKHEGAVFEPHYLLEELQKIQMCQERLQTGLFKRLDVVQCERCCQLRAEVHSLKDILEKGGIEVKDRGIDDARFAVMVKCVKDNYDFDENARLSRLDLLDHCNQDLGRACFPLMSKAHPMWKNFMDVHLKDVNRANYRPLKLVRSDAKTLIITATNGSKRKRDAETDDEVEAP
jgi:hypothetical protein